MNKRRIHPDIEILQIVASKLGPLRDQVVFVGGSTTTLYIDDPASPESLATEDVDCVIELSSLVTYESIERKLSKLGFRRKIDEQSEPICRWYIEYIQVDVMPSDPKYLGFSNKWYPAGIINRKTKQLPDGTSIYVLSAPFFIATKIEAMKNRGGKDLRFSHDLEDIFLILSGCSSIKSEIERAPTDLKNYLKAELMAISKSPYFDEALKMALYVTGESEARSDRIKQLFFEIIKSLG